MSKTITVQAKIDAPIQKVWDAYTLPEHIVHWNFASDDWECPKATSDFQVGGTFSSTMAAKDGSTSFDFTGKYTKIDSLKTIAYEFGDRTAVIEFKLEGSEVEISVAFDPENENPEEMQRGGWQAILNNFKKYVEEKM